MEIIYSQDFVKSAKTLQKSTKIKLSNLLEILKIDIFNSKLHLLFNATIFNVVFLF